MPDDVQAAVVLLVGFLAYMLPAIIARLRKHPNTNAITLANLLFGWTVLGWLVALIWCATAVHKPAQA